MICEIIGVSIIGVAKKIGRKYEDSRTNSAAVFNSSLHTAFFTSLQNAVKTNREIVSKRKIATFALNLIIGDTMKKFFAFALIACCSDSAGTATAENRRKSNMKIEIQVMNESGATARLFATLAENSSAQAFAEKLRDNPLALDMVDYSNFEKYGTLPFKLVQNDEQIDTKCGDIMLTWGNTFVIYYDHNSYRFSRLGFLDAIEDGTMSQTDLKAILGKGDVKAVISLVKN